MRTATSIAIVLPPRHPVGGGWGKASHHLVEPLLSSMGTAFD
jgi:hypothetical protein